MRIIIAGGSGLIGKRLAKYLEAENHTVLILTRQAQNGDVNGRSYIKWKATPDDLSWVEAAGDVDAVYNLSGRSISDKWTDEVKKSLESSRIESTRAIAEGVKKMKEPPKVLVNASAIGYYGSREDEVLNEQSSSGNDFFSRLCSNWESEADKASESVGRVVKTRTGIVLDAEEGALPQIVAPLRRGLGSRLGSGRQWVSWVHADDVASAMKYLLTSELEGPVNVTSPNPVINKEFMKAVANAIGKRAWMPAPAGVLRATLGEMADYLLLSSQRVVPSRLQEAGFKFGHPDLAEALKSILS